ncbi:hypothetical protein PS880_03446 [Pseudomonas fluorescens]|uniref:Uncharacterized protein n=1 Tax=Pseudomonas fluorescens TaxID=294 RepID=A0A5E7LGK5_PSEFL|nr:hypothetical protein PS880_03446 [Pseudomonas fluorescens]
MRATVQNSNKSMDKSFSQTLAKAEKIAVSARNFSSEARSSRASQLDIF